MLLETIKPVEPVQTHLLGNAPIGHSDSLFFHRAQLIKGTLTHAAHAGATDYAWLNRQEVLDRTPDGREKQLLQHLL